MKDNKKNMASLIVSKINGDGEEESSMEAPKNADGAMADTEMDGTAVAADEVFAALESKDRGAFIDAMKSMVQMCMDSDADDSEYGPE